MIKCLDSGDLYCSECGRLCDSNCWNNCTLYRRCYTCEHSPTFNNASTEEYQTFCKKCTGFNNDKWEDKYVHTGKF